MKCQSTKKPLGTKVYFIFDHSKPDNTPDELPVMKRRKTENHLENLLSKSNARMKISAMPKVKKDSPLRSTECESHFKVSDNISFKDDVFKKDYDR